MDTPPDHAVASSAR